MDMSRIIGDLAMGIPWVALLLLILYNVFQNALQKSIEAKIEIIKTKELQPIKNKFAEQMVLYKDELGKENEKFKRELDKEIELYKKELELNNAKTKIIYDNQKDAFKNIIIIMDKVIQDVAWSYDYETQIYKPLSENAYKEARDKIIGESLFISSIGARGLDNFIRVLGQIVDNPAYDIDCSSSFIEYRLDELRFILHKLKIYFRSEIGLVTDIIPLIDIELFNACRLLNIENIDGINPLFKLDKPPEQLIRNSKDNINTLLEELIRLANYLKGRTSIYYDSFLDAEECLKIITEYENEKTNILANKN